MSERIVLPRGAGLYLYGVVGAAIGLAAISMRADPSAVGRVDLLVLGELVLLAAAAQHFPLLTGPKREFDISIAVHFAILLLAGMPAAIPVVGLGEALGQITLMLRRNPRTGKPMRGPYAVLFNTSQYMVAIALAGLARRAPPPLGILAGAVTLWLANSVLVAVMAALHQRRHPFQVWLAGRRQSALQAAGLLIMGYVTARAAPHDPWLPLVMALPGAITYISVKRSQDAETLRYHALHDPLTDLPNRALFSERLEQAVRLGRREGRTFALLMIDLDGFKHVNDTLGHYYGDLLLQQIGPRLQGILRETDTVARLGGDEFAILLPGVDLATSMLIARKLSRTMRQPLDVEGERLAIQASIGLALFPVHGGDGETLLRCADAAMYRAKRIRCGVARAALDGQQSNDPVPALASAASGHNGRVERLQQVMSRGPDRDLRPRAQIELGQDVLDMPGNGALRDLETGSNFPIGEPVSNQRRHGCFLPGEHRGG
jgi:diguanylate cyclase (GGDEF)-like protein